jgi:hypothetical protein
MTPGKVLIIFLVLASKLFAGEITIIYPREMADGSPHVYDDNMDSTFIFGHVTPASGNFFINGFRVLCDDRGAFLAYLPLRRPLETKSWQATLIEGRDTVRAEVGYRFRSEITLNSLDTVQCSFPCLLDVTTPNAHTRTMRGGSYQTFPVMGTRFIADGYSGGFFDIRIGSMSGVIERRFVTPRPDSSLQIATLGNGRCIYTDDEAICSFAVSRPVAWTAESSPLKNEINLFLFDTR